MDPDTRRARVRAFAKINLSLKVLEKRPDGYHELRTVFQTVSLADEIQLEFTPARRTSIRIRCEPEIADNLAVRAAEEVFRRAGGRGRLAIEIRKRIPMGGGMGGGSSDAAAVLLALPVLSGKRLTMEQLAEIGAGLGSDVPFFLHGGTALGLGRGTELYPLPPARAAFALLVHPPEQVSTTAAYQALARSRDSLTITELLHKMKKFQDLVDALVTPVTGKASRSWRLCCENDFEGAVFGMHPRLKQLQGKLLETGAQPARMSGSGSALFGIYDTRKSMEEAIAALRDEVRWEAVRFLSRGQYRGAWWRSLALHLGGKQWPPLSRY